MNLRNSLEKQTVFFFWGGGDISHRCLPLHYSFYLVPSVFPSATNSLLVANTVYVSFYHNFYILQISPLLRFGHALNNMVSRWHITAQKRVLSQANPFEIYIKLTGNWTGLFLRTSVCF